ncbi:MAG TPA: D-aminoacylase [Thermoanaerobaculia bacterium]|nr:D-aminoacylase [Thermoanaerobaculia bacterium]
MRFRFGTTLTMALLLGCAPPTPPPAPTAPAAGYDIVIRNGSVLDGTGAPAVRADVAIRDDSIAAVGDLSGATATTVIDAAGLIVAPGFIDLLGNSQAAVLIDPRLEGKVRQGVTTEVTGEGFSPAPIDEAMAAEMERTRPDGWPPVTWRTLDDFMRVVERKGSAVNFAFYVGATNAREMVLGHAGRAPTPAELRRMEEIVGEAVQDGAVGLSSALIYPPGRFATTEELIALARRAGSYWTHLRSESAAIDAAIDEALRIGREAGVPVNIFHLKIAGRQNWGKMPAIIRKIEDARKSGIDVAANVYPYTATSTELTSIVPAWALEGGYEQFLRRVRDPAARPKIAAALRGGRLAGAGASTILVRGTGKRLDALAREMGVDPAEAALRLFEQNPRSSPVAIFFSLSEEDMKLALKQPWVAVGSDSGAVIEAMRGRGAHPRAYATFSRILRYVREEELIPLEEAIRKFTSLGADRAFLPDRGRIAVGKKADVVVFDPRTVRDLSTYDDPHHFSVGVRDVIVNGEFVLRDGAMTGALPGRMLPRGGR